MYFCTRKAAVFYFFYFYKHTDAAASRSGKEGRHDEVVKILEAAQEAQAVLRHSAPVEEEEEETSVTPRGSPELVCQCVASLLHE